MDRATGALKKHLAKISAVEKAIKEGKTCGEGDAIGTSDAVPCAYIAAMMLLDDVKCGLSNMRDIDERTELLLRRK